MEIGPQRATRRPWGEAATVYEEIGGGGMHAQGDRGGGSA